MNQFEMDDDYGWNDFNNGMDMDYQSASSNFRDRRYSNAYGDYRGGYGPSGAFGPSRAHGPMGPLRPPPLMQLRPRGPPFMWGRGYGPENPPMPIPQRKIDDRPVKYLIRCGVAKEHLRNLPRELLQLIEPQYCGLCAVQFDTFPLSRLHYISKNHLKAQKKWMSHKSDGGPRRAREEPLRARELYCELCDVHITSKVHAESHYAGKAHRAIVEGRKTPKNPMLLQRGMESRLDQLIRREKRQMKNVEGADKGVETKDVKPVSPELYCDICKTSVTCSEQMTMHLNGKRHLTKEKQHILKVMKGETNPDIKEEPEEEPEVVEGENGNGEEAEVEEIGSEWGAEEGDDAGKIWE